MAVPAEKQWTLDDFLAWEKNQAERWEFVNGEPRLMVGGASDHFLVAGNLLAALHGRIPSRCRVYPEGMWLRHGNDILCPDVMVVCPQVGGKDQWVTDATLVAEVLSPSTASRDRAEKWEVYRRLPSLRYYLLVAPETCCVDLYTRDGARWILTRHERLDETLPLPELDAAVPLAALYAGTEVAAQPLTA